jgi:branched-chain amino acid transport system substrate-binding protein
MYAGGEKRRMRINRSLSLLVCSILALSAADSSYGASAEGMVREPSRPAESVFKIGFLTSQTGVGSTGSTDMIEGIKLFLEQKHYRLAGQKVQLVVEDDESNPSVAAMKLKKMVYTDKIAVLDGVTLSTVGYAISPFIERYQLPSLFAVCGGDGLTKGKFFHWIVRCGAGSSQPNQALGAWTAKNLHYKKVVAIAVDMPYGYEAVGGFQKTFEDAGGQVVQKIWVPMGVTDFSPWIKHIDRAADAIFLADMLRSAVSLPRQIRAAGVQLPFVASGAALDELVLPQLQDECLHSYSARVYTLSIDREENRRFVAAFRHAYGHSPSYFAEASYTSGLWLEKALTMMKGDWTNRDKFLAALKSVKLDNAPRGPMCGDAFGNPKENVYICRLDRVEGQLRHTVVTTIPGVTQFWIYPPSEYLKLPAFSRDYPPCRSGSTAQR